MSKQANSRGRKRVRRVSALVRLKKALAVIKKHPLYIAGKQNWLNAAEELIKAIKGTEARL